MISTSLPLQIRNSLPNHTNLFPSVTLDAAGLVALADLSTIALRTALTGSATLLDILVIAPGLHTQQKAPELNQAEYPACGALTTGYVFRVENEAMVVFLRKVGRTGELTTLEVNPRELATQRRGTQGQGVLARLRRGLISWKGIVWDFEGESLLGRWVYLIAATLCLAVLALLAAIEDWWGLFVIGILMLARAINVVVVRRRAVTGWKGALEPGVQGDLLILLSQDRWVRMKGAVDDLKAVTSGQWLREPTFVESAFIALATLLVYLDAALAGNATQEGKLLLLVLLFASVALLGLTNEWTDVLKMHGRTVKTVGKSVKYGRRRDMADQLIKETGRDDWAIRLGMIVREGAAGEAHKTM